MGKVIDGELIAKGKRFCIVASRFNEFVTQRLLEGAVDTLRRHGAKDEEVETVLVPGSFEIPCVANRLAKSGRYNAIICLGTVVRGETPHFEYIANEAAKGIAGISMQTGIPAIFGIVTADSLEQAINRAGAKEGNKGRLAALTAIEMANLIEKI